MSTPAGGGGRERPDWVTIPNAVTLLRLILLAPVCVLLVRGGPDPLSVSLLLAWALTDWIDGFLARALGQESRLGQVLDPIADRIGVAGIVLALALADLLPWAALVVITVVDLIVMLAAGRTALETGLGVSVVGKARTALLMAGVFLLVAAAAWAPRLIGATQALLWVGVALHVLAGAGYVLRARAVRRDSARTAAAADGARAAAGPASRR